MGVTYNYGAGPTYTKIASQTLSGASATVTFSNLPQSYTDLVVVCAAKGASAESMRMQFNSDTATNYSTTNLFANLFGSPGVDSVRYTSESSIRAGYVQNGLDTTNFLHCTIQIQGYANNTTYKSVLARSAKAINVTNGLWRSASAITSVALFPASSVNFASGSTFTLYGVAAALKPKATGGTVTFDPGTSKWVHTFTSSGVFTPTQGLTVDYLVVAGGGGGAGERGGGAGAGGLRSTVTATGGGGSLEAALSLALNTNYTVTVGAGGAGAPATTSLAGTTGADSVFATITSAGGGGGGGGNQNSALGKAGGSGGGGGGNNYFGGTHAGGAASPAGQGYAGGLGDSTSPNTPGGGGGGAGVAGSAATTTNAGSGGNGVAVSISGSSITYAGGGGGGAGAGTAASGGSGGGGNGKSSNANGDAGTVNLGGGGGAGGSNAANTGGNGGSGIVIVRYSA